MPKGEDCERTLPTKRRRSREVFKTAQVGTHTVYSARPGPSREQTNEDIKTSTPLPPKVVSEKTLRSLKPEGREENNSLGEKEEETRNTVAISRGVRKRKKGGHTWALKERPRVQDQKNSLPAGLPYRTEGPIIKLKKK